MAYFRPWRAMLALIALVVVVAGMLYWGIDQKLLFADDDTPCTVYTSFANWVVVQPLDKAVFLLNLDTPNDPQLLTEQLWDIQTAKFSVDGKFLAYVLRNKSVSHLIIHSMDSGDNTDFFFIADSIWLNEFSAKELTFRVSDHNSGRLNWYRTETGPLNLQSFQAEPELIQRDTEPSEVLSRFNQRLAFCTSWVMDQ